MTTEFDLFADRCRDAIPAKYPGGEKNQASPLLESELTYISQRGWHHAVVAVEELTKSLRGRGNPSRLIGSGCSSVINYLLSLSDVNPVKYRVHWQRFWVTASQQVPTFQLSTAGSEHAGSDVPVHVHLHTMTQVEAAAWKYHARFLASHYRDHDVYRSFCGKTTDAIFGFESEDSREIARQIQPQRLRDLATITALTEISTTHQDIVDGYLQNSTRRREVESTRRRLLPRGPILFQEQVMSALRKNSGILWEDTYRFVQTAARGNTDSVIRQATINAMSVRGFSETKALEVTEELEAASSYSVCFAHHLANAITSYRSAYLDLHRSDRHADLLPLQSAEAGKA
ncbi:hypothetical protein [Anatilimnocola floriformis]|uniref:hypothetical protein n=1 Tax=Anatilimnocola floriformis TaxID=2948575 RepID=UPI0020C5ADC3|nr:hypothetical protein [Anatilimnocola floriformis]